MLAVDQLRIDLAKRWIIYDYRHWHWLRNPAKVRILIYADGSISFEGGSFNGLQHVLETLRIDPYYWVKFEITTAHRNVDPSADLQNTLFTDINLANYDQIWFFGIASGDSLSAEEKQIIEDFMNNGGGVLATGDHASLGQGIAGHIKRAGVMRKYPAPPASAPDWNNSLREGPTAGFGFSDQSDDVPQNIKLKYYYGWTGYPFRFSQYPHPVMCGPNGPITVFPDHQHEGEINIPANYPADVWPSKNGYQPKVEVIAWANILAPDADSGRVFGIVGVYDGHRADVGRIVADSTWHHWFDINLDGFYDSADPAVETILQQIEAYYLNVAIWLSPPAKQRAMWRSLTWGAIWRDPLVMIDVHELTPYYFGQLARNALGQFAPQCQVRAWLWELLPPDLRLQVEEIIRPPIPQPDPPPFLPIEDLIAGTTIRPLLSEFQQEDATLPDRFEDEIFDEITSFSSADLLQGYLERETQFMKRIQALTNGYQK